MFKQRNFFNENVFRHFFFTNTQALGLPTRSQSIATQQNFYMFVIQNYSGSEFSSSFLPIKPFRRQAKAKESNVRGVLKGGQLRF